MAGNIVRWEPMREMLSLREAMDKLFEESFVGPQWRPLWPADGGATLAIDLYETGEALVVTAPVPGVKPEEVEITVTGSTLTVKGETKAEERSEHGNYLRQEVRYGSFQRTMELPVNVQANKAEAVFENGVLTLTLPKAEQVKPKSIKINVK
jgi:HSP20 family protein